ncbi:AGE family epimerase/isomerase [Tautonia marina]|uniref:AGE family epimerase/isomerase n=1 Tax=Tautonia marina TaxID=2653855 RepID=UPI0012609C21|nr:AGE family epimerase/isomerase [Tautonia marina]
MNHYVASRTVMGVVVDTVEEGALDKDRDWFRIQTASGDEYEIFISTETYFTVLTNIDGLPRDRVPNPEGYDEKRLSHRIHKYVVPESLIVVLGVDQDHDGRRRFDARTVYLLDSHSRSESFQFETDDWWQIQIRELANGWLDAIFGDRRDYSEADFAELYRTNLNITGMPKGPKVQEMATLSRLIYGLSSAYLLTGQSRFLAAASAGVRYQREAFRFLCHGGTMCIWAFGRQGRDGNLTKIIYPSQNDDDKNQFPLYEQIYALAGLAQFFRITNDATVLSDIRGTIEAINYFFLNHDDPEDRGYYSHIDYVERRPDAPVLGDNRGKKNWNSIGDHLPAYLINLLLAIDPLPQLVDGGRAATEDLTKLVKTCHEMLRETSELIVEKFPARERDGRPKEGRDGSVFVDERFESDWTPDHNWRWQKNRGIVGHNLKIAWNLTRVANYHLQREESQAARRALELAEQLAMDMAVHGLDRHRGGCFDAVERMPSNGMPYEITWMPTKDFWQQEQAILAYLILYGETHNIEYLQNAREMQAFWNLWFLDRDRWGIYFRVTEDGLPYIEGMYGDKGGHSVSGYHSFELNFLAHIYLRSYLSDDENTANRFSLYFKPSADAIGHTINVLPDFFPPGSVEIESVAVNGVPRHLSEDARARFQIPLADGDLGREVAVIFRSTISNWWSRLEDRREKFRPEKYRGPSAPKRRYTPPVLKMPSRSQAQGKFKESEVF